ncbi:hypothetical protein MACK_001173 [Theileria orientalis]|uniref:EF-hand domain-containing protein n=1 Tax=Theileria orientalis TaxID=68886 RepID=A0A976QVF4_THEOR|nr:hypothetical protein MACK_001173 [Theileria orientalis]
MVPIGLKILSKSVAFAARFFTPLFLLFLFIVSNVFNLNELKLSKIIFDGFCNNENMDGLGRIVCPMVPMEDPFLNNVNLNKQYNIPLLISTTKIKDDIIINADSSTPSSLYLIMEVCNSYRTNVSKSTLLADLCVLINDTLKESRSEFNFNQNLSESHEELVKWKNVAALLQRLPNNGKLSHITLLSSLNRNKILEKVINSVLSLNESEGNENLSETPEMTTDLLVTSDILSLVGDPFKLLSGVAFPKLIHNSFGTIQESIYRLFLSFPEASAALLHMRNLGFEGLEFSSFEPKIDRFTHLAIFLSSFQLLLTYSFEFVPLYTGIVKSAYNSEVTHEKYKYSHLLSEFTDDSESKTFVENIMRGLTSFAINLNLKNKLFMVGDIGLKFTNKLVEILVLMNIPSDNTYDGDRHSLISSKLREGLTYLGKFISFDHDNDGFISFEEFTKASIDLNSFVDDVMSVFKNKEEQKGNKEGIQTDDDGLKFVNLLKSQNSIYDKIIDEFIISDIDRDDILTVEEFMELTLSTCIVENIHT